MHALILFFILGLPFLAVCALVIVAVVIGAPVKRLAVSPDVTDVARAVSRQVQVRNLAALAAGITVGAALAILVSTNSLQVQWLPFVVPTVTAATAILVFARMPTVTFREAPGVRTADLERRRPWSAGPRWLFVLTAVSALVLIVTIVLTGLSAMPDGRSFGYARGDLSGTGSPYPGFFFGVPALVGLVVLAIAVLVALARITSAARPTSASLRDVDTVLRQIAVRVVLKATISAILVTTGGAMFSAGGVLRNASYTLELNGGGALQPAGLIGTIIIPFGAILVIAGIVFFVLAVLDAVRRPIALLPASTSLESSRS